MTSSSISPKAVSSTPARLLALGEQHLWAHSLRTDADGEPKGEHKLPECHDLKSLSHEGRIQWHAKKVLPPGDKPLKARPRRAAGEHDEQLLYVALYRDKIAEHQAEAEAQQSKDAGVIAGVKSKRQRPQVAAPVAAAEASVAAAEAASIVAAETSAEAAARQPGKTSSNEAPATDATPASLFALGNILASRGETVAALEVYAQTQAHPMTSQELRDTAAARAAAVRESGYGAKVTYRPASGASNEENKWTTFEELWASSSSSAAIAVAGLERGASLPPLSERLGRRQRASESASGGTVGVAPSSGAAAAAAASGSQSARATHIASVTATPGAGGVANEYLETKRLGKLFDEWKSRQNESDEDGVHGTGARMSTLKFAEGARHHGSSDSNGARSGRHATSSNATGFGFGAERSVGGPTASSSSTGTPRAAASTAAQGSATPKSAAGATRTPKAKAKAAAADGSRPARGATESGPAGDVQAGGGASAKGTRRQKSKNLPRRRQLSGDSEADAGSGSPTSPGRTATREVLDDDFEDDDSGSDASEHQGTRVSESKLVSRLFQVVCNPKVTGEASGVGEVKKLKETTHVEGFPTLNLMRLYKGPWRLDV